MRGRSNAPNLKEQAKLNAQSALIIEKPKLVAEFRDEEFEKEMSQLDSKFKKVTDITSN